MSNKEKENEENNKPNNIINDSDKNNNKKEIKILSLNEKLIIFPKEQINADTKKSRKIICEFAIPLFHYYRSSNNSTYLFRDFVHTKIKEFPVQYVILNNDFSLSARQLYEYVWNLNIVYMNHPNINTSSFWWNQENKNIQNREKIKDIKNCYPFVLRYSEIPEKNDNYNSNLIHCPLCSWYNFCPGCIINPNDDLRKFTSEFGIVVDWCYSFVINEFHIFTFQLLKEIDDKIVIDNLPENEKRHNLQDIKECINSFFSQTILDNPIYCQCCMKPEKFYRQYKLKKLPNILILSLKRFQLLENNIYKLNEMITYSLYNFELLNRKYDLYGVINHNGTFNSGHYNAIVKVKDEWIMCDDEKVYPIEEKKVINKNAYILFYVAKNFSINSKRYIKDIISHLNENCY